MTGDLGRLRLSRRELVAALVGTAVAGLGETPAQAAPDSPVLFPVAVPWDDDSPGVTDLSGWNRPIEAESDRLRIGGDGHFYRGGERVRLFGFDLASGAALLDHGLAERVAAHLAKFGVNYVRVAQHSNPSPAGWLDPSSYAGLDPEARDRLDFFLAQLRRHGIYAHLVLTHFRRAYPRGIPGYEGKPLVPWGWPREGTGITEFFTPVLLQNRAVARELLLHTNPYTGLPYARDPAVAIVEVTNEDGLLHVWHTGQLDSVAQGSAPHLRPLRDELQARWNRWLRARYRTEADLREAWSGGFHPGGPDVLDGRGPEVWRVDVHGEAQAEREVLRGSGPGGSPVLVVRIRRPGRAPWHVTVTVGPVRLRARPVLLSFWARASAPGLRVGVTLQQARPPYRILASSPAPVVLDADWRPYRVVLAPDGTEPEARVNIAMGVDRAECWLSRVSFRDAPAVGLAEGESPWRGTVPPFLRREVALRTGPARRDWVAFLYATERQFFDEAFRFLREELGVRAAVVGTQSGFSPLTIQALGDVVSVHAYWSHPVFPGRPWDSENWYVLNRSMAAARDEWNTLNRVAFRRWAGKPLVVDEYNHPQPDTFGAEGFPLAAVYGAFQDWDGIAGWAYREGSSRRWLEEEDLARPVIRGYFSLDTDPVKVIGAWLAAVLFRRGDVAPGRTPVLLRLTPEEDREIVQRLGPWRAHEALAAGALALPFRRRVGVGPAGHSGPPAAPSPNDVRVTTDTGEVAWDVAGAGQGVVTVAAPRAALVIGTAAGREYPLGDVVIVPGATAQRGFGVWAVVAMDGNAPLRDARHLVVVALGYSQNTGTRWAQYPDRPLMGPPPRELPITVGRAWGDPPVLAEGIAGSVIVPAPAQAVRAWTLDSRGQRARPVPVRDHGGRAAVDVGPVHRALWYVVDVDRAGIPGNAAVFGPGL